MRRSCATFATTIYPTFLVYIAQMEECVFPDKTNCTVCPFFHLCMFVEFPEEDIRKWLESEVEADV